MIQEMKDGFYPALGTPTDENSKLVKDSFSKQIEMMIDADAKGVLCMGSMGKMISIRDCEYPAIAKQCVDIVSKRVPVMMGVMDCSVDRIIDRIDALDNCVVDGVVATVPYYFKLNMNEIINFFRLLAKRSKYPVYIYDLPSVTQAPVSFVMMQELIKEPNIIGIKTANMNLILEMKRNNCQREGFSVLYSGLDLFDVALNSGIKKNLDGMFTCTPVNSKKMYENMGTGTFDTHAKYLNNIIKLRNILVKGNIFSAYSYAMGLLGCPGNYQSDYDVPISEGLKEEICQFMKEMGEL
ncbi:dihydrodipicolinate synthase family protein [Maribellus sp. CM-23]|uniref:dihydrodipicolinate synthase family protein n=1 Tax=Maribellus sp. CM-23 TaxID=2781026 RepID=UPI001F32E113|nr:dihydrodipicolinate synthase family protein [Maribellus sp. CM-23]MCE4565047.1 dihydrodipicolinate synthase family protein [Maribellus sp. CM-23]